MPSKEEIYDGVKDDLIEALALEDDEITPNATLIGDLGAESIDLLDIVYRLEKRYNIKIERGELAPEDIVNDTTGKYVVEGKFTDDGLAEIRKRLPNADLSAFEKNPVVTNLTTILTVKDLCYLVEQKLGA
ncbi:acyl carrier protein [Planctomycetales bacterium]|nr:acyl carrier protein [Planctomycetales bacterium]GHT37828.1 acyl carrier protein [Planctomycetales bacterium]